MRFLDEIEALKSIYSNESIIIIDNLNIDTELKVQYNDENYDFSILFNLPPTYPIISNTPITWEFRFDHKISTHPSFSKFEINRCIEAILVENINSEVLFLIIEAVRNQILIIFDNTSRNDQDSLDTDQLDSLESIYTTDEIKVSSNIEIFHSDVISEKKSSFQAHFARVNSINEVNEFRSFILNDKKFKKATHNIFVYRFIGQNGLLYHDNDDDGETAAGSRLAEMIRLMNVEGIALIVSRWFGGILLGPDRFKYICNVARNLLEFHGYGITKKKI